MPLIGGEGGWLLLIIKRAEALRNFTFGWEMKKNCFLQLQVSGPPLFPHCVDPVLIISRVVID